MCTASPLCGFSDESRSSGKECDSFVMVTVEVLGAIDELERLSDTLKAFKERNGKLPNPDSDARRAVSSLEAFAGELNTLHIGKLVYVS